MADDAWVDAQWILHNASPLPAPRHRSVEDDAWARLIELRMRDQQFRDCAVVVYASAGGPWRSYMHARKPSSDADKIAHAAALAAVRAFVVSEVPRPRLAEDVAHRGVAA